MNETLVLIDMQPRFDAARSRRTIKACQREIRKAMQECNGIVYVQYNKWVIHKELRDLTLLYSHKAVTSKKQNDGSQQILRTLKRRGFSQTQLRICGVNAGFCVYSTVAGLRKLLPEARIVAVADAINCLGVGDGLDHRKYVMHTIRLLADTYKLDVENRHLLVPELTAAA